MLILPKSPTSTTKYLPQTLIGLRRKKKQQQQHALQEDLNVPKGCLAVNVGEAGGEHQRFVVPVIWFNHPLFTELLKEAEDEYGFDQKGTINIPCNVRHFCNVISRIIHHYDQYRNQQAVIGCFRRLG